ncbi:MAG: DNA polymerase III subunit beta [Pseudomonadota bacterium]
MKLTIDRSDLLKALSHVQNVVERRNTIPILSNVLLTAEGQSLSLTATDLDIEAADAAGATVHDAGAVTAPAHTLFDVVRKLPDGADVTLETSHEDGRLAIASGRARFALPTLPADDFQTMAREDAPVSFDLEAADLRRLIDKTRFAISTEETRYYLNGIYLHFADEVGGVLRAVATDGHRLALADMPAPDGANALTGIIVPRKAIAEARRLLDDAPDRVTVSASDSKIVFKVGEAVLTSKLIDGSFPDYQRVIPKENGRILTVDNGDFAGAVDRVATVSAERSRSIKLSLDEGKLTLAVSNAETGQGVEELEAEYADEALEIGFNARYLLDVAQQIEGDETRFEFNDSASPARVIDMKDPAAQYVLMPLRV